MKHLAIITSLMLLTAITSCSDSKSPYHERVIAAAYRDADKVIQAPAESMEREHAVLAIRVRQHALSSNGHRREAELYFNTVHHILVDSLHIIECRQIDVPQSTNQ